MSIPNWISLACLVGWAGVLSKFVMINWGIFLAIPAAIVIFYIGESKLKALYR